MVARRHTETHSLDSWMSAIQIKATGTQKLTVWMGFHGGMAAIQTEVRTGTRTHSLDGISWRGVNDSNQTQDGLTF